jgi:beta-lactamase class A
MLTDISVYFRKLDDGSWFVINGSRAYSPASLMKVAFLITILKQSATEKGLLNKKIYFEKHNEEGFSQNIKNFSLTENKYYSIKELLYDMIVYSDNDALIMIGRNVNQAIFQKLFSDLGVTAPPTEPAKELEYMVTLNDYCKFFRILYNSGYLTDENSELALSMLSQSTYRGGLLKDISPNLPVAHKFGERISGTSQQLHEIGIFYTEPQPYLLGVMSEGTDLKKLSDVLSQISQVVYGDYANGN